MASIDNFLNISDFVINELVGSAELFSLLIFMAIIYGAVRFNIPDKISLMLIGIGSAVLFALTGLQIIWVIVVFCAAGGIYFGIDKIINR